MKNYRASKQSNKERAKNNAYMKKYRDLCGTLENNECQNILNVAPAESNRWLSIFRDKHSEKLAYPGIFLGQKKDLKMSTVWLRFTTVISVNLNFRSTILLLS